MGRTSSCKVENKSWCTTPAGVLQNCATRPSFKTPCIHICYTGERKVDTICIESLKPEVLKTQVQNPLAQLLIWPIICFRVMGLQR